MTFLSATSQFDVLVSELRVTLSVKMELIN